MSRRYVRYTITRNVETTTKRRVITTSSHGAIEGPTVSIEETESCTPLRSCDSGLSDGSYHSETSSETSGSRNVRVLRKVYSTTTTTTSSSGTKEQAKTSSCNPVTQSQETQKPFQSFQLFNLPSGPGEVTAFVIMPSGDIDRPIITDNQNGTVSIKYEPRKEGLHELHIKYNTEHIQGSPFKFFVDSIQSGFVTAYGPGLTHGIANEPTQFHISTKAAGAGGLAVAVEGPSKADITYHDNKDGTVTVTYLPAAPGEYKVIVKFGDKDINGSPFIAKVTGEGRKRSTLSLAHSSEVSLKVQEKDVKNLNASIVSPSGLEEPCFLKVLPDGKLGISFTPRETGEHNINVRRTGQNITGSPFKINVLDCEIGDSKRVKVSGPGLNDGETHKPNEFEVDTKDAGYGGLSLSIEGPSKAEIQTTNVSEGKIKFAYIPTEPGYYIINLKFADHHVRGSPYTVKVEGKGSNIQRENIKKQREAQPTADVGTECKLTYQMPSTSAFDMAARVTSPSGNSEDCDLKDIGDSCYCVQFKPKEAGVHTVSVRYKGIHIPGSPFQYTVGPLQEYGAHRVHAGGVGLERGVCNEPCQFNVWTREAGAGSLAVSVEGPSKAQIQFNDRKDGSCSIAYTVKEAGEYRVGIKFNDQHIPDSPFKVYILQEAGDASKIELGRLPDTITMNTPIAFPIYMNGAKGHIDGKVVTPSGKDDDCFVAPIDEDQWALRFVPHENGVHQIHIRLNGVHIPASPFRVQVGADNSDPAAVQAFGPGLKDVTSGTKTDFIIDTCNAGAGALSVKVDGPTKVSMDCTEVEEGYKVRYTPLAGGDYFITVKFNGYHISGSPFRVKCTGGPARTETGRVAVADMMAPETSEVSVNTVVKHVAKVENLMPKFKSNASKVTSKGVGLRKAVIGRSNNFQVCCTDAGNNLLYVMVHGPKGPSEECNIKHQGNNNYQVTYLVRDRGDYLVIVKWGDEHIPGSPFKVIGC